MGNDERRTFSLVSIYLVFGLEGRKVGKCGSGAPRKLSLNLKISKDIFQHVDLLGFLQK